MDGRIGVLDAAPVVERDAVLSIGRRDRLGGGARVGDGGRGVLAGGPEDDLAVAGEVVVLDDDQRLGERDEHALATLLLGERHGDGDRLGERLAGGEHRDLSRDHLGQTVELGDASGDAHPVADGDLRAVGGMDEDGVGRCRLTVAGVLHVVAVESANLEVAGDDPLDRDRGVDDRGCFAGTLNRSDRGDGRRSRGGGWSRCGGRGWGRRGCRGGLGVGAAGRRVRAESVERVDGVAVPLRGRVEGVGRVGVAGADVGLAAQGVVGGGGQARTPLGARVDADLSEGIDHVGALDQHDGVVAVEPAGAVGEVGLGEHGWNGAGVSGHEHIAGGDGAGQRDGQAGGGGAVEVEAQGVLPGSEIDGSRGRIREFDGLVVRRALDVLADEEVGRGGGTGRGSGQQEPAADEGGRRGQGGKGLPHGADPRTRHRHSWARTMNSAVTRRLGQPRHANQRSRKVPDPGLTQ